MVVYPRQWLSMIPPELIGIVRDFPIFTGILKPSDWPKSFITFSNNSFLRWVSVWNLSSLQKNAKHGFAKFFFIPEPVPPELVGVVPDFPYRLWQNDTRRGPCPCGASTRARGARELRRRVRTLSFLRRNFEKKKLIFFPEKTKNGGNRKKMW